ncbi:hypothetical protein VNO77_25225 [Canavalia gladiata]|uniref:Uncharacterized protein n=1 Tax=Canavalia gladiata TaxID=3824 RepID=A0AAN9L933_CANGL
MLRIKGEKKGKKRTSVKWFSDKTLCLITAFVSLFLCLSLSLSISHYLSGHCESLVRETYAELKMALRTLLSSRQ